MKRKSIEGLIIVIMLALVAILSGCVQYQRSEETVEIFTPSPTPIPTSTSTPTPTSTLPRQLPTPTITKSGTLTHDEIWSGVIHITGDVIVPKGKTLLTIEPGTMVMFAHNREHEDELTLQNYFEWPKPALYVQGKLLAEGTPEKMIIFTSDALKPRGADYRGIIIDSDPSAKNEQSAIRFCIIEYGHKNILLRHASPLIENNILRSADHLFKKAEGVSEFEGGSGITYWGGLSPIIRGNIIYGNTHNLEIRGIGNPAIENNVIAFGQKRRHYYGGANGIRTWGAGGTPTFKYNLIYGNWWGVEFNWGSEAIFKNNVVVENDVGLIVWQGDPGETKSRPIITFNNVWGNGIDYTAGTSDSGHGWMSPGENDISVDPMWTEKDFRDADFLLKNPTLKDAGDPALKDIDGSRSDIGPNWDWSWVDPDIL